MPSVFISYSHNDKPFATKMAESLRVAGVQVWIDDEGIKIGDSLSERIPVAINDSDYLLAVISKNSVASSWVKKELALAMMHEIKNKKVKILPVLIDADCDIPESLRDKFYADFTRPNSYTESFARLLLSIVESNKSGDIWQDSIVGLEFCYVQGGVLFMGSDETAEEQPIHSVEIEDFWIGKYMVTNRQYRKFQELYSSYHHYAPANAYSNPNGDNMPAVCVGWYGAKKFADWLSLYYRNDGFYFRVPTEAEWEYACRAGSTDKFFWGSDRWQDDEYICTEFPRDVGTRKPNNWGLYDMIGIVPEWCYDIYSPYKNGLSINKISEEAVRNEDKNPYQLQEEKRVVRGILADSEDYEKERDWARVTRRGYRDAGVGRQFVGFRLVRVFK